MLVDLARNDVGRVVEVRHRAGGRPDDGRALLPRDAPHAPRSRATCAAGKRRVRRAAGHVPGRHGAAARRRCGRWRSSTSSSRPSAARTPGPSATSTSPATSTPASRSARWCGAATRRACRPARASSPTRRRARGPRVPQQGAGVAHRGRGRGRALMAPNERLMTAATYRAATCIEVADRRPGVTVTGPDTWTFLPGLVSQDLDAGHRRREPRRRSCSRRRARSTSRPRRSRVGDDARPRHRSRWGDHLAEALTRFKIRVKADVEDRTAELRPWRGRAGTVRPRGTALHRRWLDRRLCTRRG